MNLRVTDINVLVKESVGALLSVMDRNGGLRTALAREELKVLLDPVQMGDDLAALLSSAYITSAKGAVITVGTRFLPIRAVPGNENGDKISGCALLYVDLDASETDDRSGTCGSRLSSAFQSFLGIVKKINGCARVLSGRGKGERLNIYLPVYRQNLVFSAV